MQKRGRASRLRSEHLSRIPIVDAGMRIVGWTSHVPVMRAGEMRHLEAESLLGGPVHAIYVELTNLADAIAAGAPSNWREPWRCLALADLRTASAFARRSMPTV